MLSTEHVRTVIQEYILKGPKADICSATMPSYVYTSFFRILYYGQAQLVRKQGRERRCRMRPKKIYSICKNGVPIDVGNSIDIAEKLGTTREVIVWKKK
jgi:hypothetical protein